MPTEKFEKLIKKINEKITDIFSGFSGSYLYGSIAKGNYAKNSDIDIIFVFSKNLSYEEEKKLARIIGIVEAENDIFLDYHPYTIENLKQNPIFYNEVVGKGFYYEAA